MRSSRCPATWRGVSACDQDGRGFCNYKIRHSLHESDSKVLLYQVLDVFRWSEHRNNFADPTTSRLLWHPSLALLCDMFQVRTVKSNQCVGRSWIYAESDLIVYEA